MITSTAFAGKHYAVLGLARSGLATVEALLASGARVTAWDDNSNRREETVDAVQVASHDWDSCELAFDEFVGGDLTQFDSIVVTPGLPLNRHPIAARARGAGVEIIGDIELFARARSELPPHKVVGITGTNGKSTTTALVHHILQTAGVPSLMGGNIGLPILSQEPLPEGGVYVLELSSYQIDLTKTLDCDVAVLLNITPDHLDRYDGFEAYAASKMRLFAMQRGEVRDAFYGAGSYAVDAVHNSGLWTAVEPLLRPYLVEDLSNKYRRQFALGDNPIPPPSLRGSHNEQNLLTASLVVGRLRLIRPDDRIAALMTFPGLPHRMERIRERNGVLFVNDSKATNAEAAAPALAAYPKVRWIVGGQAKAETLGDTAKHLDHVAAAYTIGEAGPMFARLLRAAGVDVIECETLENAVRSAAEDSQPGETVLLSPASASFDQFRDFEERGDRFRDLVGAL